MKTLIVASALLLSMSAAYCQENKIQAAPPAPAPVIIENPNAPVIKFAVETYDFGTIKQGEKVTYDFTFVNTGKEPLIITEARGSCGCTVPQFPKEPIAKGGKGKIHVVFDSTGKLNMQDKTVTITSNAKGGQKVLHLTGNVEAPPMATPAPINDAK